MGITVKITSLEPKEWNLYLLKNSQSTTYQTSHWLSVYNDAYDSKPLYIYAEDGKGNIIAQLAASIHDRYFWADTGLISKKLGSKLHLRKNINWNYGSIIFEEDNYENILQKILSELDHFAVENKITSITGMFPPSKNTIEKQSASKILLNNGYDNLKWGTYILRTDQNIPKLFESYDKKTRYDIRKSEQENLEFKVVNNFEDLNEFRLLKIQSRDKNDQRSVSNEQGTKYYEKLWKYLYKNNLEKMFLVIKDNKPISGMRVLTFNKNLIQFAVVNQPGQKTMAGTFLTWNVIKWAHENNFLYFDLGGINPKSTNFKEKQIDFYKAKWGGELFHYIRCSKIFSSSKMKLSSLLKKV